MSEPFLGEIRIFGFNFAPRSWAFCDGQILPINQNQALYSLLGTTYGGDGRTSFALPDLRGRTPVHEGSGFSLGAKSGAETVAITTASMPNHTHAFNASTTTATENAPGTGGDRILGASTGGNLYASPNNLVDMNSEMLTTSGSGASHNNIQPTLVMNFAIALQGIFPSRN